MDTQSLYNRWAPTYDEMENPTRDVERRAGQAVLGSRRWGTVLEMGCGTGKNTAWLAGLATAVTAVDFSEGMLARAREKVTASNVRFVQADATQPWRFVSAQVDLVTFSLVLEHVQDLSFIFQQAATALAPGGRVYVCELHPYKQYAGSKARFATPGGVQELPCFVHHVSDYTDAAAAAGLSLLQLREWFDGDERQGMPRLLSLLFGKD